MGSGSSWGRGSPCGSGGRVCAQTLLWRHRGLDLFTTVCSEYSTKNKFDQLMGSKVIELILSKIDLDGVGELLKTFQHLLTGPQSHVGYVYWGESYWYVYVYWGES